jgi:hypothetical protein
MVLVGGRSPCPGQGSYPLKLFYWGARAGQTVAPLKLFGCKFFPLPGLGFTWLIYGFGFGSGFRFWS